MLPTMFDAYLFDLDGTLMDTEVLWVSATREYLRGNGVELTPGEAEALVYGRSWHDIYRDIARAHPALAIGAGPMADALEPYFESRRSTTDARIRGSIRLLRRLAEQAPVCVVTGSPRRDAESSIAMAGIAELIAFSICSEDYPHGKPDPSCFLLAAARFGVPPERCLVFEDSTAGVQAAKAAGMTCVALVRENCPIQDTSAADRVVADLCDFDPGQLSL
jgi:sugar-phosphatase